MMGHTEKCIYRMCLCQVAISKNSFILYQSSHYISTVDAGSCLHVHISTHNTINNTVALLKNDALKLYKTLWVDQNLSNLTLIHLVDCTTLIWYSDGSTTEDGEEFCKVTIIFHNQIKSNQIKFICSNISHQHRQQQISPWAGPTRLETALTVTLKQ